MRFNEGELMPAIVSLGLKTGSRLIANEDIGEFLDKKKGLVDIAIRRGGVGIKTRYWSKIGEEATSDLATGALQEAMETGGIQCSDVVGLYLATTSPDFQGASTAAIVQNNLGLPDTMVSSSNADACPGFVLALRRAYADLTSPLGEKGYYAVVGVEVMSPVLGRDNEFSDGESTKESIAILAGDGAGAAVINLVLPDKNAPRNMGFAFGADGRFINDLRIEAGGSRLPTGENTFKEGRHNLSMNGRVIFDQAVIRMTEVMKRALLDAEVPVEEIDVFVPHQANLKIMKAVAENLGILMEKVIVTVDKYGNTSAASIPMALYEGVKSGKIRRNQIVGTCAFGAGLAFGAAVLPMVGLPR